MKHPTGITILCLLLGSMAVSSLAAPFAENICFTQPDGTEIVLFGRGDEFHADVETLDGYTVVFNHQTTAYEYADLSADGNELVPGGLLVGVDDPKKPGKAKHLRINPEARKKHVAARFQTWDEGVQITARWAQLKAEHRKAEKLKQEKRAKNPGGTSGPSPDSPATSSGRADSPQSAPPPTSGAKVGLTLLIDFSDAPATVPQANLIEFCNADNYTGYGNNGSVKEYFEDNSRGLLIYTNVVTAYVRVPNPKSYYNDTSVAGNQGARARLLINDALTALKALTNYNSEILPTFASLSVDGSNRVLALNVFFAGSNSGVWGAGLWPHSWSLSSSVALGNGKSVFKYQITNIGSSPSIRTFCHENGHLLLGYPDIYDYDNDSKGGAGIFCLMGEASNSQNPSQLCAYLKYASGWSTTIDLADTSSLLASVSASGPDFNKFYRYQKPGVATEYYLVENRQKAGRDANLPAAGIAIWHIDELGDHDNQSTAYNSTHANYEVSLVQADNLYHFQNDVNNGDSRDLYYSGNSAAGYNNTFFDFSAPSARWWDGTSSQINFSGFSASGTTMTFQVANGGESIVANVVVTNIPAAAGQASFDFGPATLSAFRGAGATTPNAKINSGSLNFLGVNSSAIGADSNANAVNDADGVVGGADQERLRIAMKPGSALTALVWNYSRADGPLATDGVSISGFTSDPGAIFGGGITGTPVYSGGTLRFQITAFNVTENTIYFTDYAASAGATLEITVADSTQGTPQFAIRSLSFTPRGTLFFSDFDSNAGASVLAGGAVNTTGSASISVPWSSQTAVTSLSGLTAISTGDGGTASGFVKLYNGTAPYANANNLFIGRNHNLDTDRSTSRRGYSLNFTVAQGFNLGKLTVQSGHATANGVDQIYASTLVYKLSGGTLAAPVSASSVEDYTSSIYNTVVFNLAGTVIGAGTYTLEVYQTEMTAGGAYAIYNGFLLEALNTLPVAGAKLIGTLENQSATVSTSELISLASDVDGDVLNITSVDAASTNGAVVTVNSGIATYTPVGGFVGMDAFSYLLNDGNGGTATGTVQVAVVADDAFYNRIQLSETASNAMTFSYQGIPNEPYAIEHAPNLAPPVIWTPLSTNWTDSAGVLSVTNSTSGSQGFFRIRSVP